MSHTLPSDGQTGHTLEIESKNGVTSVYLDGMEVRHLKHVSMEISHDDHAPLVTLAMEAAEVTIDGATINFTSPPSPTKATGVASEPSLSDADLVEADLLPPPYTSLKSGAPSERVVSPRSHQTKGMTRFPAGSGDSIYRNSSGQWFAVNVETGLLESYPPFMSRARLGYRLYTFKCPSCHGKGYIVGTISGNTYPCGNCLGTAFVDVKA